LLLHGREGQFGGGERLVELGAGLFKRGLALLKIYFLLGQGSALEFERAPHRLGRLKLSLLGLAPSDLPELLGGLYDRQRLAIDRCA
jgi:hypothetical protein